MRKQKKERMKTFVCSCCGKDFKGYPSEQRQFGRDNGYGLCESCQDLILKSSEGYDSDFIIIKKIREERNYEK